MIPDSDDLTGKGWRMRREKATIASSQFQEMHVMDRPVVIPKPCAPTLSSFSDGIHGLTRSTMENFSNIKKNKLGEVRDKEKVEALAQTELNIIRHILIREQLLNKLSEVVLTIHDKFKDEIQVLIDSIRTESLQIIEAVVKWRDILGDHKSILIWNDSNYLLKMTTDLDYLNDNHMISYHLLPIPLLRNPFFVTFPLSKFALQTVRNDMNAKVFGLHKGKFWTLYETAESRDVVLTSLGSDDLPANSSEQYKIRCAEVVIMKEEETWGAHSRDPDGRIVPRAQALARFAANELRRDDFRSLDSPARSIKYAPHAILSDIGAKDERTEIDAISSRDDPLLSSSYIKARYDSSLVESYRRGATLKGGELSRLQLRGILSSRPHRPLMPNISAAIEFRLRREHDHLVSMIQNINAQYDNDSKFSDGASVMSRGTYSIANDSEAESGLRSKQGFPQKVHSDVNTSNRMKPFDRSKMNSQSGKSRESKASRNSKRPTAKVKKIELLPSSDAAALVEDIAPLDDFTDLLCKKNPELEALESRLSHLQKQSAAILSFKSQERTLHAKERSRQIERRRRLLHESQGRRIVPLNDSKNVYDYFACRIQALIRGWLGRIFVKWYRHHSIGAIIDIQRVVRGWIARRKIKSERRRERMVCNIQRVYRGWRSRKITAVSSAKRDVSRAALLIQRTMRGRLGRLRHKRKRELEEKCFTALGVIDSEHLTHDDVRELGHRIENAIVTWEGEQVSFPPEEILEALRIMTIIVQVTRGSLGYSSYDFINRRQFTDINGETMTWDEASKLCSRSRRLLHVMRSLTYGTTSKPPRILFIPQSALRKYYNLIKSQNWSESVFGSIGQGQKFCQQLFLWINLVVEIFNRQPEYLTFLTNRFPNWLPALYEAQKSRRKCEYEMAIKTISLERLKHCLNDVSAITRQDLLYSSLLNADKSAAKIKENEELARKLLQREIKSLEASLATNQQEMVHLTADIERIKHDQSSREKFYTLTFESRFIEAKESYDGMIAQYQKDLQIAEIGSELEAKQKNNAQKISGLSNLLRSIEKQKMLLEELETQLKLLLIQVAKNIERRRPSGSLTAKVKDAIHAAADMKADHMVASIECSLFCRIRGFKNARYLTGSHLSDYFPFAEKERMTREEYHRLSTIAIKTRVDEDAIIQQYLQDILTSDDLSKNLIIPSEEQLQEERAEDDRQAQREKQRKMQFISAELMNQSSQNTQRKRNAIFGISRDVPWDAKQRLIQELSKRGCSSENLTIIDFEANHGFDILSIQSALNLRKNIILHVDVGLTYATRQSFLVSLNLCMQALTMKPLFLLAVGDDCNEGFMLNSPLNGVARYDLDRMKDRDIKCSLDRLGSLRIQLQMKEMMQEMQSFGYCLLPPNEIVVFVMEAFFVLLTSYRSDLDPSESIPRMNAGQRWRPLSWPRIQLYLRQPHKVRELLDKCRRGFHERHSQLLQCLEMYIRHSFWPQSLSMMRVKSSLLNTISLFVETWHCSEIQTFERGGIPQQPLIRDPYGHIAAVAVVRDALDSNDHLNDQDTWEFAAHKLLKASLSEMEVARSTISLNKAINHVTIYRENDAIYFDLYDPINRKNHLTTLSADRIPKILAPNATESNEGRNSDIHPPTTVNDMYSRLARSLVFDHHAADIMSWPILNCRKRRSFIVTYSLQMNGFSVDLNCFEEAFGELFFEAVVSSDQEQVLTCPLSVSDRLQLYNAADESEKEIFDTEDARFALLHVVDRLIINPNRAVQVNSDQLWDSLWEYNHRHSQSLTLKLSCNSHRGRKTLSKLREVDSSCFIFSVQIVRENVAKADRFSIPKQLYESGNESVCLDAYDPKTSQQSSVTVPSYFLHVLSCRDIIDENRKDHSMDVVNRLLERISIKQSEPFLDFRREVLAFDRMISNRWTHCKVSAIGLGLIEISIRERDSDISSAAKLDWSKLRDLYREISSSIPMKKHVCFFCSQYNASVRSTQALETMECLLHERSALELVIGNVIDRCDFVEVTNSDGVVVQAIESPLDMEFTLIEEVKPSRVYDNKTMKLEGESNRRKPSKSWTKRLIQRNNRQGPAINMELALDEWAGRKRKNQEKNDNETSMQPIESFVSIISPADDELLHQTVLQTMNDLIDSIETRKKSDRTLSHPSHSTPSIPLLVSSFHPIPQQSIEMTEKEIIGRNEKLVVKNPQIRVVYREGNTRWHGSCTVSAAESTSWTNIDGKGRRMRLILTDLSYEQQMWHDELDPSNQDHNIHDQRDVAIEGVIHGSRHLSEILGPYGQDLLDEHKVSEMVLYIAKYCMQIFRYVVAKGGRKEYHYRVHFESDRLYDLSQSTSSLDPEQKNQEKKQRALELERLRGRKILRFTRRINGLLLQLTVFDVDHELLPHLVQQYEDEQNRKKSQYTDNKYYILASDYYTPSARGTATEPLTPSIRQQLVILKTPKHVEGEATFMTSLTAPAFRIVGFDPRWKRKAVCLALPAAVVEMAGGIYSPLLASLDRRKDLAKVVCENLTSFFPRGPKNEFELALRWSKAPRVSGVAIVTDKSSSVAASTGANAASAIAHQDAAVAAQQAAITRILRRPNKIYHDNLRISKFDCIVTMFSQTAEAMSAETKSKKIPQELKKTRIVVNIYISQLSQFIERFISEEEQIERLGQTIEGFREGSVRSAALRRLCRYFRVYLEEDDADLTKQKLVFELCPPGKDLLTEYLTIAPNSLDKEEIRPTGIPTAFIPLDLKGKSLMQRGMCLPNRDANRIVNKVRFSQNNDLEVDCIVSVYTKTPQDQLERGLVIQVFHMAKRQYALLHVGQTQLRTLCDSMSAGLLDRMIQARCHAQDVLADSLERDFQTATNVGDLRAAAETLQQDVLNVVCENLAIRSTADDKFVPYFKSAAHGSMPL